MRFSPVIQAEFTISFSYRDSALYREGVRARMHGDVCLYPMAFPDPSSVLPAPVALRSARRIIRLLSRVLFTGPLLVYEVARLARLFSFITGSIAAAERLQRVLRLPARRCRSIQSGASMRSPSETVAETRRRLGLEGFGGLLFAVVGVLEPRKGHHVLLEALHRVRLCQPESMQAIRVVLAGQGPLERSLRQQIADAGLEKHCFLIGQESNIANLFAVVDVLIAPSVGYEDFPNVILEAMGSGKAVIASRVAGAVEQVVDRETGLLVTPGNSDELADAICHLCNNRNLAGELGSNGLRRFQGLFTAERAVGRYLELYRSLMEAQ